jgi:hypothetical protein
MQEKIRILSDINDKLAWRDELIFEVVYNIDQRSLLEKHILLSAKSRAAYMEYAYGSPEASSAKLELSAGHSEKTDLRVLNFNERIDWMSTELEKRRAEYSELKKRLIRITKLMEDIIANHPFLEEYNILRK